MPFDVQQHPCLWHLADADMLLAACRAQDGQKRRHHTYRLHCIGKHTHSMYDRPLSYSFFVL